MSTLPRFMIAAAHKSSGKTVVSTGITRALHKRGLKVGGFKKGPDYIDPLWLSTAGKSPCYNLDFNTMGQDELQGFFADRAAGNDISVIEANKGLFDGMDIAGSDSNAEMAKLLGVPVILVIDCVGMTRGIAPLLQGYVGFDSDVTIAGVILNRVGGPRHEAKLREAVETFTDLPVLGAIRRSADMIIDERHLGLITPAENAETESWIDLVAELVAEQCDLDALISIANAAAPLKTTAPEAVERIAEGLRIGIARDSAFGFYYADDLEAFETAGASLVPVNMLEDSTLPEIDALFIGGGFPETHMQQLASNSAMRTAIRTALDNGLPCYAECGGLMYLCNDIRWGSDSAEMVGFFDATSAMHAKPQGRGYVRFKRLSDHPWGSDDQEYRAHEFHYARIENTTESNFCRTITRGFGTDGKSDGLVKANTVAGFVHMRHTRSTPWVHDFLRFVKRCQK